MHSFTLPVYNTDKMPRVSSSVLKALRAVAAEATAVEASGSRAFSSLAATGRSSVAAAGRSAIVRGTSNGLANHCRCACGRLACFGTCRTVSTTSAAAQAQAAHDESPHAPSLGERHQVVSQHFPSSMGADDFMARVEMALAAYGFTGDNAIGEQLPAQR